MTERDRDPLNSEERRAQQVVRSLPQVEPEPGFRTRLRRQFAEGTIAPLSPSSRRVVGLSRPAWGALLALAAVFAGVVLVLNRGPGWEFTGMSGEGKLIVAGQEIERSEWSSIPQLLLPGVQLRTEGEAQVNLLCGGHFALQLAPGAEMTLPGAPGRWFQRKSTCEVTNGEVRFVTGPKFAGAELRIESQSADIEVQGTTLAVIVAPCSTCVCVLEGQVTMVETNGARAAVRAGKRRIAFDNGHEPFTEDIKPGERMKLDMLRSATESALRPDGE